jgi:hypothetical protein
VAIIGSLFAFLGRFAGKVVNALLSWATVLLFGSVERSKQTVLTLVALGAVVWVVLVLGVLIPDIGAFLLVAVPIPDFIDETIIRLAMLVAAVLVPLAVGGAVLYLVRPEDRPQGGALALGVLRGYPFTITLAVMIVFLAVVSAFRKVRAIAKRWETDHVPVVVKPGQYDRVLGQLHDVLGAAGLEVTVRTAPSVLSMPARILAKVAGSGLGEHVPDKLMLLVAPGLEILVYPSDVAISGSKELLARSRAAIATLLTHAPAYMTMSPESQKLEDEIEAVVRPGAEASAPLRLQAIDRQLARLTVPFDEWETVYRERLQVERDLLANGGQPSIPGEPVKSPRPPGPTTVEWAAAALGVGLLAADVVLMLAERVRPPRRLARTRGT